MIQYKEAFYNGIKLNKYLIYENGDVFSLKSNKKIKARAHSAGYLIVTLWNPKQLDCFIHRLVAENFLENNSLKKHVNHKDGNKHNNHMNNLEWVTEKENIKHSYSTGLNKRVKLTADQVKQIRELINSTGMGKIAKMYNVSERLVFNIKHNKIYKHVV